MTYKYGDFSSNQIANTKEYIRKRIFFLMLLAEPNQPENKYSNIDINDAFDGELRKLGGLNSILFEPPELVRVISLLEAALIEYNSENFDWLKYRKLVLDAGNEVLKIKEV